MRTQRCDDIPSVAYLCQYLTDHGVHNALRADGRINVLDVYTINGVPGEQWRDIPATFAAVRAFLGYWRPIQRRPTGEKRMKYAVLVYQAGIANVFTLERMNINVNERGARRLLQSDFRTCEAFARGLAAAGVKVTTAACNCAGDAINAEWSVDLDEQPFSDKFCPVFS